MPTQVLDKMRGEAAGFDTHLRTLEEAVAGKTGEKETMQLALRDANAKKESAKQVSVRGVCDGQASAASQGLCTNVTMSAMPCPWLWHHTPASPVCHWQHYTCC